VIDLGCKTATTKIIASSDREKQAALVNSTLIFRLVVIAAVAILVWSVQELLMLLDSSPGVSLYLNYIPLMLAVASMDELCSAMLQGFHAYRHLAIAQIARGVLRLCLTILLLNVMQLGVLALIYSWVLSFIVSILYQYAMLPIAKLFRFHWPTLLELLRFGFPLHMTRFLWLVFRRIDVLLIGLLAGSNSAAFYEVAARIPDALQRMSESFTNVYFPTMASLLADGKRQQAIWMWNQALRLLSFATALGALLAVLFSHQIVTLVFSTKYLASSTAFAVLMIAFHTGFMINLMGYTLTALGYPMRSFTSNLFRSAVNVGGDLLLIPIAGFMGPVYATLVANYTSNPLSIWLLRRSGVEVQVLPYLKQTLILLLCVALFWWFQPIGLIYKLGLVTLFVVLNLAMATISLQDVRLTLPHGMLRRSDLPKESLPHGH
jgi:O-antigen/teichoic acid export membrane protein